MIDHGKYRKRPSKQKCTKQEYNFQEDYDITQKVFNMFCDKTQFPLLTLFSNHQKLNRVWGLNKYYNIQLDTKLGNGTWEIREISCAWYTCTSIL